MQETVAEASPTVPECEGDFASKRYVVARGLISPDVCRLIYDYILLKNELGQLNPPDERIPGAPHLYADPLTDALLLQKQGVVQAITGCDLSPSYSYVRLHAHGASMPAHTDREASEVGVTINMGGDRVWPIWFKVEEQDVPVELGVGDAAIYYGRELPHWREPYEGHQLVQTMLFFVRTNGEFAAHRLDGRTSLGRLKRDVARRSPPAAARSTTLSGRGRSADEPDEAAASGGSQKLVDSLNVLRRVMAEQAPYEERVAVRHLELALSITSALDRLRADTAATKEPETLDWIESEFCPGDVLYDVGANVGIYTLFAALHNPRGQVVAFEPAAANTATLCRNVRANRVSNVTVCSCGVGASSGFADLHLSSLESGGSMHSTEVADVECFGESAVAIQRIAVITLDDAVARFGVPTLLKIDIDGREREALAGAERTLAGGDVRSVLLEINWAEGDGPERALRSLERHGFELVDRGAELQRGKRIWRNHIFRRIGA